MARNPRSIGRFSLLDRLGEGGMGVVYLAEQTEPIRRRIALKLARITDLGGDRRTRFERERQALASLEHANIARIFEAGETDEGVPYFAMELVEGARPITAYANEQGLGVRARLDLFCQVCAGVQHGHERGVLHRDLKPSNILVSAEGRPKIIDYGLARLALDELVHEAQLTRTGEVFGTVHYLSPEQCRGQADERSDVYSLGVLLFELLTGRLPYDVRGRNLLSAMRIVMSEVPSRPSSIETSVPRQLDGILLRALAKEPAERHPSARALEEELRAFLENPGEHERRRSPRGIATVAGLVLVALSASIALAIHLARPSRAAAPFVPEVVSHVKIGQDLGGFTGALDAREFFGSGLDWIGDFDGDGNEDLVVGAAFDDDGGYDRGALWLLFLDASEEVASQTKISQTTGGFLGELADEGHLGACVKSLGDLDGDGHVDLVAGCGGAGSDLWVLFLRADGTVRDQRRIDGASPTLARMLGGPVDFGASVAPLGDVDGDGVVDIAAGDRHRDGFAVLFLDDDGSVADANWIAGESEPIRSPSEPGGLGIGYSVAGVGDVDGDGIPDVAFGAEYDAVLGGFGGLIAVATLTRAGEPKTARWIRVPEGRQSGMAFGIGLASIGDVDGNGVPDLAAGGPGTDQSAGGLWIVTLERGGAARAVDRLDLSSLGLPPMGRLGESVASWAGSDGAGIHLVSGAYQDGAGAAYLLQIASRSSAP